MTKRKEVRPLEVGERVQIGNWPYAITRNGEIWSEKSQRFLSGGSTSRGYRAAILSCGGDRMKVVHHRLVARAFLGPQQLGTVVNHKNGNKHDNRVENLEYCTPAENRRHAKDHGLYHSGDRCSWAKLSTEKARIIRERHGGGESIKSLAREYGVDKKAIQNLVRGKSWRS